MSSQNPRLPKKRDAPLFFISAGDPSGDAHAARLVSALKEKLPASRFIGFAGPKTAKGHCDVRFDLTKHAAMMLKRALLNLPNYLRLLKSVDSIFREERPDAVILVDFPGFNWQVAKKAKAAGIPVIYFMPPQIWGWGQWRARKMRKYVDLVLACFRFEDQWFKEQKCNSVFVGHPFFEEERSKTVDQNFIETLPNLIHDKSESDRQLKNRRFLVLLPGSRDQEVIKNASILMDAAKLVTTSVPDVVPVFAAFKESQADRICNELKERDLDYPVFVGKTPELMRASTCCLSVSGSVSIELLSLLKPSVIVYRISKIEYFVLRFLKRVKYITLTNILYVDGLEGETPFYPKGRLPKTTAHSPEERKLMLFPEFITTDNCSADASVHLIEWFANDESLQRRVEKMKALKEANDVIESPIEEASLRIIEFLQSRV